MDEAEPLIQLPPAISFPAFTTPRYIGKSQADVDKGLFARTASRALVKLVVLLKCTECQKPFTSDPSPLTAHCGHHFCAQCVGVDDFFKARGLAAGDLRSESYECKGCKKRVTAPVPEESKNSFIPNKFLTEFLNALDEPGYRCKNCHQLHPRNNAVALAGLSAIVCVWCAAEKNLTHGLEVIGANHEVTEKSGGERLDSVDRIHKESLASGLILCSYCNEKFLDFEFVDNEFEIRARQLPCGHFQHSFCESPRLMAATCQLCPEVFRFTNVDVDGKTSSKKKVFFFFKKKDSTFTKRENPKEAKTTFGDACGAMGLLEGLKRCKKCNKLHPPDNFEKTKKKKCVWCAIETQSA